MNSFRSLGRVELSEDLAVFLVHLREIVVLGRFLGSKAPFIGTGNFIDRSIQGRTLKVRCDISAATRRVMEPIPERRSRLAEKVASTYPVRRLTIFPPP